MKKKCCISESLYRHCLFDGTWFSCPSLLEDNIIGNGNRVGWTNYSLCWTASTQKIMEDLNQTASCPGKASEENNSAEVGKVFHFLKKNILNFQNIYTKFGLLCQK